MGSRQLGELLLRPNPLRWWHTPCLCPRPQRAFTLSAAARAAQPQHKPAQNSPAATATASPASQPASKATTAAAQSASAETSNAIDNLFRLSGVGQRTSSDQFGAAAARHTFGATFSKGGAAPNYRRPGLTFDDMNVPVPENAKAPLPFLGIEREPVYPRLTATTGRTVELDPKRGRDIVRGLSMLGSLVARNKIKRDFQMQRYHERPGLKRKRLKSERWRARFKKEFADRKSTRLNSSHWE